MGGEESITYLQGRVREAGRKGRRKEGRRKTLTDEKLPLVEKNYNRTFILRK